MPSSENQSIYKSIVSYKFLDLPSCLTSLNTRNTNISVNVVAHNFRWSTRRARDVDILEVDSLACRSWAACKIGYNLSVLSTAGSADVDEVDVCDVDLARVCGASGLVDFEVALVQHNWVVCVLDIDIFVCDIVHVAVANIGACPSFEACTILAVEKGDIFDPRIGDVVLDAGVLAYGAHRDAMSAVAPQVLDEDVGGVGFGREAVVTDIHTGVGNSKAVNVEGIETVCVLGE